MADNDMLNSVRCRVPPLQWQAKLQSASVERRRIALVKWPTVAPHGPGMSRPLDRRHPGWRD